MPLFFLLFSALRCVINKLYKTIKNPKFEFAIVWHGGGGTWRASKKKGGGEEWGAGEQLTKDEVP